MSAFSVRRWNGLQPSGDLRDRRGKYQALSIPID
jgi:hypothetical protein